MAIEFVTVDEIMRDVGMQIRELRLAADLDQAGLARAANVSLSAVKNLEAGQGSSLRTMIPVARALGRLEWLHELRPVPEVSPMAVLRASQGIRERRKASPRRKSGGSNAGRS
jgi:transcriptional regulator with XRE-family HTH domain